jgi:RNA-directed DNA polymerase
MMMDSIILQDLADLLLVSYPTVMQAVEDAKSPEGYLHYQIPKGNGKMRDIHAPSDALKTVQKSILTELLNRVALSPFAHGFAPGKSIITNAKVHANTAKSILSIDLLDAFPSVSNKRVFQLLQWYLGSILKLDLPHYNGQQREEVYHILTQLCTRDEQLPQGAPTSGYLLNLACTHLDRKVFKLVMQAGLAQVHYSRYADDLTITSSAPIPPEFQQSVLHMITKSGFRANYNKIEHYHDSQKALVICGIRIYQGNLALPRRRLKEYRALFDHALSCSAQEISIHNQHEIIGTIAFLRSIYPTCPPILISPLNRLLQVHAVWLKLPKANDNQLFNTSFKY